MDDIELINLSETRSLSGLINYYHKFIPNAAEILYLIYTLLRKNRKGIFWSHQFHIVFEEITKISVSDNCLVHLDSRYPIIVSSTDASQHGIGGILTHI